MDQVCIADLTKVIGKHNNLAEKTDWQEKYCLLHLGNYSKYKIKFCSKLQSDQNVFNRG